MVVRFVRRPTSLRALAPIAVALLVGLAGCAGSPEDDHDHGDHDHGAPHHHGTVADEGTLPLTGEEDVVIEIAAGEPNEFAFNPSRVEVEAGQRIGLVLRNVGDIDHELAIKDIAFHLHAESNQTVRGAFRAPEPGHYEIGCYLPGHLEAGMKGTLVVV